MTYEGHLRAVGLLQFGLRNLVHFEPGGESLVVRNRELTGCWVIASYGYDRLRVNEGARRGGVTRSVLPGPLVSLGSPMHTVGVRRVDVVVTLEIDADATGILVWGGDDSRTWPNEVAEFGISGRYDSFEHGVVGIWRRTRQPSIGLASRLAPDSLGGVDSPGRRGNRYPKISEEKCSGS